MTKLPSNFELDRYGLHVRLVREEDAEFIVKLRTDPVLSRFIHATDPSIEKQKEWIRGYKQREEVGEDFYFIFFADGMPMGLFRLYGMHDNVYTAGSWLCEPGSTTEQVVATAIIIREIAFDVLGYELEDGYDGVHVDNKQVYRFNKMIGLEETGRLQDVKGEYITMQLTKERFETHKRKLLRLIGYTN